ncbi:Aldo/keto reductase [Amylocystis lapponica]|nr:Aldo/keto reductase [Amylocystis lapponica]
MPLPIRKIGNTPVSAIGYGAMGISTAYGKPLPDEERLKILDAVYEGGCTNWDTADVYKDSEVIIGKWLKRTGKRSEIFLATKFAHAAGIPGRLVVGDPGYVPKAIDLSLQRLGVDYVDLWYYHRVDPTVPIELTVGAMAEQVKAGKVKYLGLSECSSESLRRAHAVHPISAVQVEYSPFTLDIEDPKIGLMQTARELGVAIVAYSPLGRGLLTGSIKSPDELHPDDFRRKIPRYSKENFPNILKLAEGLQAIGVRHGATAGQVALAWVLAQGENIIPIPGSTKLPNLKENQAAADLVLTKEELEEVRAVAKTADAAHGDRYPPAMVDILFGNSPPLTK